MSSRLFATIANSVRPQQIAQRLARETQIGVHQPVGVRVPVRRQADAARRRVLGAQPRGERSAPVERDDPQLLRHAGDVGPRHDALVGVDERIAAAGRPCAFVRRRRSRRKRSGTQTASGHRLRESPPKLGPVSRLALDPRDRAQRHGGRSRSTRTRCGRRRDRLRSLVSARWRLHAGDTPARGSSAVPASRRTWTRPTSRPPCSHVQVKVAEKQERVGVAVLRDSSELLLPWDFEVP